MGTNGFTTGTGGDNVFFVNLNESGTPDTDARPGVNIIRQHLARRFGRAILIASDSVASSLTTVTFAGTSDADTGIDPTTITYTHAVDFRGADATPTPAVINGLAFADGTNTAGQTDANTGNGFGLAGVGNAFGGDNTGVWADPGSGLEELTRDFYFGGNPGTLTLSDLTPGETYKLRLFVAGYYRVRPDVYGRQRIQRWKRGSRRSQQYVMPTPLNTSSPWVRPILTLR